MTKLDLLSQKGNKWFLSLILFSCATFFLIISCQHNPTTTVNVNEEKYTEDSVSIRQYTLRRNIKIKNYFTFMDSLVKNHNENENYSIDEYSLAFKNKWIIDTLANTDYYVQMDRGQFIEDSNSMLVFRKGDQIIIPSREEVAVFENWQGKIWIDVNIPEYKLRIMLEDSILMTFLIRVGRNEQKYLAMAGRVVDLKTQTGTGKIIRINRDPSFINPSNNKVYKVTRRDDGNITKLPNTPWIEPELDGYRYGQLIHPTTNAKTLGKAYSNGCVGMREADMWRLYFYAPLGTKVVFRYDLNVLGKTGEQIILQDIYQKSNIASLPSNISAKLHQDQLEYCICMR